MKIGRTSGSARRMRSVLVGNMNVLRPSPVLTGGRPLQRSPGAPAISRSGIAKRPLQRSPGAPAISRSGIAKRPLQRSPLGAMLMFAASAVFAASEDGHREHDPHEHGHGTLDVVVEGEDLVIELRMPGVNVVGFEHAPGTDAEREAVEQALARFRDPAAVLVPSPGAECEPERVEAALSIIGHEDPHDHDEHHDDGHEQDGHAHEKHEHDRHEDGEHEHEGDGHARDEGEHGHDEHHDDEQEKPDANVGAEAHSELHATYHFHCHAPERLDRIQVRVFEFLRDAEGIEARVVTPTLQKAMDLRPGEAIVELSR